MTSPMADLDTPSVEATADTASRARGVAFVPRRRGLSARTRPPWRSRTTPRRRGAHRPFTWEHPSIRQCHGGVMDFARPQEHER